MLDFSKLHQKIEDKTLLGVGPVTKNTIDAAINIANLGNIPIQLIPSRRQVDAKEFGGGYVMNTSDFAQYVRERDKKKNIVLARDHGGPYQGSSIDEEFELENAIDSYEADISADFDILHIDPSLNPKVNKDFYAVKGQIGYLIQKCEEIAEKHGKSIFYEIGTDGHGTKPSNIEEMKLLAEHFVSEPKVKLLVANTGTCVKEKCNVGKLHVNETLEFVNLCKSHGLLLKEHNLDYTVQKELVEHRRAGIHSANVAPEFGVEETKCLLWLLRNHDLHREYDDFVKLAYESGKWKKWMINGEHPDKEYLALICGHYIMETPQVKEIKNILNGWTSFPVDQILCKHVEKFICRYLEAFGWFI